MRKFFILALILISLMMGACVEQRNRVILEKFVPITKSNDCKVSPGGDLYQTKGIIDLAFSYRYLLGFQITNYIPSSQSTASGSEKAQISGAETNYFYGKWVEIKYEWDPNPQADGRKLELDQSLWNKTKRVEVHGIVVNPDGGQAAGVVDIFNEVQAKNLLEHVNDIDWVASPLLIKVKIVGELTDGTEVSTNVLNFNIVPDFGGSIQMGSVYYVPEGGFKDDDEGSKKQNEYNAIVQQCAFEEPILNGCFPGQDSSAVNCYAGDTPWQQYIAESRCYLTDASCYVPGYAAAGVVEVLYNRYKKDPDDKGSYACCPSQKPEAPEEEKEEGAPEGG